MCSRFLDGRAGNPGGTLLSAGFLLAIAIPLIAADQPVLRICADPNNLPFSNQHQQGFENRIASLLAKSMGARLDYEWWAPRKDLVEHTLGEGRCDALMGVPDAIDDAEMTKPYYRSTYVFVSRKDRNLRITSLTDPRLAQWRIGLHIVGDDYAPPAIALARRGLASNLAGYNLFGGFGEANPPARLIDAVAAGKIDVAIAWGPFAGYFGPRENAAIEIAPVEPQAYMGVPFVYDITIAARKGDTVRRDALNAALRRNCAAVRSILQEFGVPLVPTEGKEPCDVSRESSAASLR